VHEVKNTKKRERQSLQLADSCRNSARFMNHDDTSSPEPSAIAGSQASLALRSILLICILIMNE